MGNHDRRSMLLDSYENAAVIVSGIEAEDLGHSTPCRKYDVAGLVDHIVEPATGRPLLAGVRHLHPETIPPTWICPTRPGSYATLPRTRGRHGTTTPGQSDVAPGERAQRSTASIRCAATPLPRYDGATHMEMTALVSGSSAGAPAAAPPHRRAPQQFR
jgi:hypothetical protein